MVFTIFVGFMTIIDANLVLNPLYISLKSLKNDDTLPHIYVAIS